MNTVEIAGREVQVDPSAMPPVNHFFGGDVYAKEVFIDAGKTLLQHKHSFDHLSFLASGAAQVIVDGVATDYVGPKCLLISAGKHHAVHAITDVVWYCVHATDCTDPEKVDEVIIGEKQ